MRMRRVKVGEGGAEEGEDGGEGWEVFVDVADEEGDFELLEE